MNPDVSIVMITYYHEKYIGKAIESVLRQNTQCKCELIIADDFSKDGTRNIIKKYVEKYPDIIKPIFNEENVGITRNIYNAISHCSGNYVTFLSGDDFWNNDNRIETQYRFLEKNKEYIAVTGITEARLNGKDVISTSPEKSMINKRLTLQDYLKGHTFDTHAVMFRNIYLEAGGPEYLHRIVEFSPYIDDSTMCILLLKKGAAFTLPEHFGVYRVIKGDKGAQNYNSINSTFEKAKKEVELYNNMAIAFCDMDLTVLYGRALSIAALALLSARRDSRFRHLFNSLPDKYRNGKTKRAVLLNIIKTGFRVSKLRLISLFKAK